ncbi:hypothetical protein BH23PAT2_BH23PAT2_08640 [soil metagenome]
MSSAKLGKITSDPNDKGEHTLKCPQCSTVFLSTITTDDATGVINNTVCSACSYSGEPKLFVAAAHQAEVNEMTTNYVTKELKNAFRGFR